jgi:GTP:adenosylcobinamide-phosphate guanylyltransferase
MAQAVVFIEKNEECFEPLLILKEKQSKPKCLLPIVNIPIIDYTIASLKNNKFASVTIICSSHVNEIKGHVGSTWSNQQGFEINVVDGSNSKGILGDALSKLDKKKFTQPFLLLYGDIISNIDFHGLVTQFASERSTCLMLALLKDFGTELRDGDLEPRRSSAVVWDNTNTIQPMHFQDDGRKFWRQEKHDNLKRGLLASAAVCSPNVLNFSDNYKTSANLQKIMWELQRDTHKIKPPALAVHSFEERSVHQPRDKHS